MKHFKKYLLTLFLFISVFALTMTEKPMLTNKEEIIANNKMGARNNALAKDAYRIGFEENGKESLAYHINDVDYKNVKFINIYDMEKKSLPKNTHILLESVIGNPRIIPSSGDYYYITTTYGYVYYDTWEQTLELYMDTSETLENISHMFEDFVNVEKITGLENLNTSEVTDMSYMFYNMKSLTSLDVSGLDTLNVTNMSHMFWGVNSLTSLNLNNWNTTNVANMSCMFYGMNSLKNLNISNWNTINVTNMSHMFYQNREIEKLDLNGWDTRNVNDMSRMFAYMVKLSKIIVGKNWVYVTNSINTDNMFAHATQLKGYNGTTYESEKVDGTYARVDSISLKGYLSYDIQNYISDDIVGFVRFTQKYSAETESIVTIKNTSTLIANSRQELLNILNKNISFGSFKASVADSDSIIWYNGGIDIKKFKIFYDSTIETVEEEDTIENGGATPSPQTDIQQQDPVTETLTYVLPDNYIKNSSTNPKYIFTDSDWYNSDAQSKISILEDGYYLVAYADKIDVCTTSDCYDPNSIVLLEYDRIKFRSTDSSYVIGSNTIITGYDTNANTIKSKLEIQNGKITISDGTAKIYDNYGNLLKTYTLTHNYSYTLSYPANYILNTNRSYIFTGTDTTSSTIGVNVSGTGYSLSKNSSKIYIKYDTTTIRTYNVVNISTIDNNYRIYDSTNGAYIFTNLDTNSDTILSKLNVQNGSISISGSTATLKDEYGKILRSYTIANISSTKYNSYLDKTYILDSNFNIDNFTYNRNVLTATVESNKVTFKDKNNNTLKSWDVIGYSTDYKINSGNIYTKNDTDNNTILSKITTKGKLQKSISNNVLTIKYNNDETIETLNIINIKNNNNKYTLDFDNHYIYTGSFVVKSSTKSTFESNFTLNNATFEYSSDFKKVNIKATNGTILDSFYLLSISHNEYEINTDEGYIFLKNNLLRDGSARDFYNTISQKPFTMSSSKMYVKFPTYIYDKLEIYYNDILLDQLDVVYFGSEKYEIDFEKGYMYLGQDVPDPESNKSLHNIGRNLYYSNSDTKIDYNLSTEKATITFNGHSIELDLVYITDVAEGIDVDITNKYVALYDNILRNQTDINTFNAQNNILVKNGSSTAWLFDDNSVGIQVRYNNEVIDTLEIITLKSNKYEINYDLHYIYIGQTLIRTEEEAAQFINDLKIDGYTYEWGTGYQYLNLKAPGDTEGTIYDIIYVSPKNPTSTELEYWYPVGKDYIYVGAEEYNSNHFILGHYTGAGELRVNPSVNRTVDGQKLDGDKIEIEYQNLDMESSEIIKTLYIVKLTVDDKYKVVNDAIYIGNNVYDNNDEETQLSVLDSISVENGIAFAKPIDIRDDYHNNILVSRRRENNTTETGVASLKVAMISSTEYDLDKKYINVPKIQFNPTTISCSGCVTEFSSEGSTNAYVVNVTIGGTLVDKYYAVNFTSDVYDLDDDVIKIEDEKVEDVINNITCSDCNVGVLRNDIPVTTGDFESGDIIVIKAYDGTVLEDYKTDYTVSSITLDKTEFNLTTENINDMATINATVDELRASSEDRELIWKVSGDAIEEASQTQNDKFTFVVKNKGTATITAKLKKDPSIYATCTVTVSPESHTVSFMGLDETITVYEGEKYGNLPDGPTKKGYDFIGWYKDIVSEIITFDSVVDITEDTTLKAAYETKVYNLDVQLDGGYNEEGYPTIVSYGEVLDLQTPEKDGHSFTGWSKTSGEDSSLDGNMLTIGDNDTTVKANWEVESFTITFNKNYGTDEQVLSTKNVTYNEKYGTLETAPVREGYIFDGWYTGKNTGAKIESNSIVQITKDATLYAHWSAEEPVTYSLTVDLGGGTSKNGYKTSATYGEKITLEVPTKDGYTFAGWLLPLGAASSLSSDGKQITIKEDTDLSASWDLIIPNAVKTSKYNVKDNIIARAKNGSTTKDLVYDTDNVYTEKLYDKKGNLKTTNKLATGDVVKVYLDNNLVREYTISVNGDVNGDGIVDISDMVQIYRAQKGKITLQGVYKMAADVAENDKIDITDLVWIYRYIKGKIEL